MNSRQRRKLAAKKHNALILEKQAYAEDRIRDPAKYAAKETGLSRANAQMLLAMGVVFR